MSECFRLTWRELWNLCKIIRYLSTRPWFVPIIIQVLQNLVKQMSDMPSAPPSGPRPAHWFQDISHRYTTLCRIPLESGWTDAETSTWQHTTFTRDIHASSGIWTHYPSKGTAADLRLLFDFNAVCNLIMGLGWPRTVYCWLPMWC